MTDKLSDRELAAKLTDGSIIVMTTLIGRGYNSAEGIGVLALTVATMIATSKKGEVHTREWFNRYLDASLEKLREVKDA